MSKYSAIDQLPIKRNIRDLGGFPTKDGRHVAKGLLFRSSAIYFFDEEKLTRLRDLYLE